MDLAATTAYHDSDPFFGAVWIDEQGWREHPREHLYVHGGFTGTDTRFSIYFPPADRYEGRFLQFIQGGYGGSETAGTLGGFGLDAAFMNGCYLVESNQGHLGYDLSGVHGEPTVLIHRAGAAAARFARHLSATVYDESAAFGYIYGGSGGALRAAAAMASHPDLYDGAIAYATGLGTLYPAPGMSPEVPSWAVTGHFQWSLLADAEPHLRPFVEQLADAMDAGGTGDPLQVVPDGPVRDKLRSLYAAGFPRGAEFLLAPVGAWLLIMPSIWHGDPTFVDEFFQMNPEVVRTRREFAVAGIITGREVEDATESWRESVIDRARKGGRISPLDLDAAVGVVPDVPLPLDDAFGAELVILTGAAAGRRMYCTGAKPGALLAELDELMFADVEPGDRVRFDTGPFTAFRAYHTHLVSKRWPGMAQFFDGDTPLVPQRPIDLSSLTPIFSGRCDGKLVVIQHLLDRECWPVAAHVLSETVRSVNGSRTEDVFRIYWLQNTGHATPPTGPLERRLVRFGGALAQTIAHVILWTEAGVAPPPSTSYEVDADHQIHFGDFDDERHGIQPVVELTVDPPGEIAVGQTVQLRGRARMPDDRGAIVKAEWSFGDDADWTPEESIRPDTDQMEVIGSFTPEHPGEWMVTLLVHGNAGGSSAPRRFDVQNLARVRVRVRG